MKGVCHMLCPKCSAEMAEGFIDNLKSPIFWKTMEYQDNIIARFAKKWPGRIQLGDGDWLTGWQVTAFYCSACKLVLIDDVKAP